MAVLPSFVGMLAMNKTMFEGKWSQVQFSHPLVNGVQSGLPAERISDYWRASRCRIFNCEMPNEFGQLSMERYNNGSLCQLPRRIGDPPAAEAA